MIIVWAFRRASKQNLPARRLVPGRRRDAAAFLGLVSQQVHPVLLA